MLYEILFFFSDTCFKCPVAYEDYFYALFLSEADKYMSSEEIGSVIAFA